MIMLKECQHYIADTQVTCDAAEMFFNCDARNKPEKYSCNEAVVLFKSRNKTIEPGDIYLHIVFWDDDTGEYLDMNCRKDMHILMMKYNLYPPIVTEALKNELSF